MNGIDRAQVDNARLQLEWSTVTAPADGVTGIRQVDPGNLVHATDATGIVLLTQLDPIAVIFTLPQDVLPRIDVHAHLKVEAYVRDSDVPIGVGTLALVDNQVNPGTATLRLKAVVANPSDALWPNQFVKARVLVSTRQGAIVVPAEAVQRGAQGSYVYVVRKDSTVQPRDVQVESYEGPLALIKGGLQPGERVVTNGQNQLKPGAKVKVTSPSTAPAASQVGT
jgi:multidrug efflux system membrane fusion protein